MGILISFILWYKTYLSTKDKPDLFVCSFLPSDVRTCWKRLDNLNHKAVRKAVWDCLYIFICVKPLEGESFSKTGQTCLGEGGNAFQQPSGPVPTPAL